MSDLLRLMWKHSECEHKRIVVDESLSEVTCKGCGQKINPVSVLLRMAREESRIDYARMRIEAERKALAERRRTRCDHCGKMTTIRCKPRQTDVWDATPSEITKEAAGE